MDLHVSVASGPSTCVVFEDPDSATVGDLLTRACAALRLRPARCRLFLAGAELSDASQALCATAAFSGCTFDLRPTPASLALACLRAANLKVTYDALVSAVSSRNEPRVRSLLACGRVSLTDYETTTARGCGAPPTLVPQGHARTALMVAAAYATPRIVAMLLDAGADPNERVRRKPADSRSSQYTALHYAAHRRGGGEEAVECVAALLQAGADANAVDTLGYTPLMVLCRKRGDRAALIRALIAGGADPAQRPPRATAVWARSGPPHATRWTHLSCAVSAGVAANVRALVEGGACVGAGTVVRVSAVAGEAEAVRGVLREHGMEAVSGYSCELRVADVVAQTGTREAGEEAFFVRAMRDNPYRFQSAGWTRERWMAELGVLPPAGGEILALLGGNVCGCTECVVSLETRAEGTASLPAMSRLVRHFRAAVRGEPCDWCYDDAALAAQVARVVAHSRNVSRLCATFTLQEVLRCAGGMVGRVAGVRVGDAAEQLRRLLPAARRGCGTVTLSCGTDGGPTRQAVADLLVCVAACRTGDEELLRDWADRRLVAEARCLVRGGAGGGGGAVVEEGVEVGFWEGGKEDRWPGKSATKPKSKRGGGGRGGGGGSGGKGKRGGCAACAATSGDFKVAARK